jgi:hypothetical protein
MSIELRNRIETDFGVSIPMHIFLEGLHLQDLSTVIMENLAQLQNKIDVFDNVSTDSNDNDEQKLIENFDHLSDDQVDDLLDSLLSEQGKEMS